MKEKWEEYKMFFLIVIMAVTGATTAFFKIGIREIPIDLFTFIRFFFALLVLAPYLLTHKSEPITNRKKLILISIIAAANVFLFIVGLKYTTASISGMLYAAVPLITSAMAFFIIREKVSLKKWLGIIVGFIGVLVIVAAPLLRGGAAANGTLVGNLTIFIAVLAFCLYFVLSKKYSSIYSPIILTKYFFVTTFVIQAILISFHPSTFLTLKHISWTAWGTVIYSGVIGTTLYYFLYQYVIKKASPVLASTTFFLQPLANIMWAKIFIGEELTTNFFLGMILIFIGMAVVFHEQYSRPKISL